MNGIIAFLPEISFTLLLAGNNVVHIILRTGCWMSYTDGKCVCACACVCERQRPGVGEREREREREIEVKRESAVVREKRRA